MKFSHLHVHTQYSLLDGAASIASLYKKAIADGMPALAISDHGNMFGVFDFVAQAYKNVDESGKPKVKPIVGCEFYVTTDRHRKTFTKEEKDPRFHQIFLAKNEVGYKNLMKLTSLGYTEGLYSKYPRIDKNLIVLHHEGLIATTCCLGAMVPQAIMRRSEAEAETEFKWWLDLFGEDFYVEFQRHGMAEQDKVNAVLIKFARKYGVKIIASNDSHYTDQSDFNAHDILLCINTGEKQATPALREFSDDDINMKDKRFAFPNDQFYFKTTAEISKTFEDLPEAIDNTNEIVGKVDLLNLKRDILLPAFPIPKEFQLHTDANLNQWEFLKHLTYQGAKARYSEIGEDIRERIDFELFTIKTMGFAGYFLIVSDFIKAGRDLGVYVGPGRGSAAGSVVAYCIGITNIDPIKYNLLFERFLNPDRKSMPDIDTDFDDEGRQKVIDYVVQKYGKNQVAQIVTYGTMAAKMSIKDVARVMDLPLSESNALAKLVPEKPGTKLVRVLHAPLTSKDGEGSLEEKESYGSDDIENVKRIREVYNTKTLQSEVLHIAEKLEGSVRNTGVHAAGIIIAPKDLTELIPVFASKDTDLCITQIEGSIIEDSGVIKMDFLGLKTLSILRDALIMIKENHDVEIDIDNLPLDDKKTYELYQRGDTIATFQFESPGMQKYLKELKPDQFADLIAMNALYRPGPMAYIPQYVDRKHGREQVSYDLPEMEEYLQETYGITVYQEQVMLLALLYIVIALILLFVLLWQRKAIPVFSISGVTKKFFNKILSLCSFVWGGSLVFNIANVFDSIVLMAVLPNGLAVVGIYTLAQNISSLIQAPQRGITSAAMGPLSQAWKEKSFDKIRRIYQRSSINQLLFSCAMFSLIWLNFRDGVLTFNLQQGYLQAQYVFLFIGIMRIIDMGTGVNAQIIGTSTYWRFEFITGLILLGLSLPLNFILTRNLGLIGPAISNLIAFTIYNGIRFYFLYKRFGMQPFTKESAITILVTAGCFAAAYFLFQNQTGLLWIGLRSSLFVLLFALAVFYLKLSPDLEPVLATVKKRLRFNR